MWRGWSRRPARGCPHASLGCFAKAAWLRGGSPLNGAGLRPSGPCARSPIRYECEGFIPVIQPCSPRRWPAQTSMSGLSEQRPVNRATAIGGAIQAPLMGRSFVARWISTCTRPAGVRLVQCSCRQAGWHPKLTHRYCLKWVHSNRVGVQRPVRFRDSPTQKFTDIRKPDRSSHN